MKRDRLLPLLVFGLIQFVLLIDVVLHDPRIGYDAEDHLSYISTLAQFRLPSPTDSREFFCPPLPYVVPALAEASGLVSDWWAVKAAQFANLVYSIGLCVFVLKICEVVSPGSFDLQFWSLALLAIIPAYYKSFSMVRGEPLLSFLAVASVYYALRAYREEPRRRPREFVVLGVLLGLAMLSRQWALPILPAMAIYAFTLPTPNWTGRILNLKPLVISFAIASVVGGWWYASLYHRFETIIPYSRPLQRWTLAEQPARFYFGLGLGDLFTDPIRPSFSNELIPTFYAEFWGDWECYFLVYGKMRESGDLRSGKKLLKLLKNDPSMTSFETNRFTIGKWLGVAHAGALAPSALFFAGFIVGMVALLGRGKGDAADGLFAMVIFASMAGYFWYMIALPSVSGNTIKATYMLQVLPLLAVLGARRLIVIRDRSPLFHKMTVGLLTLSAVLNAPFLFTRYVVLPW